MSNIYHNLQLNNRYSLLQKKITVFFSKSLETMLNLLKKGHNLATVVNCLKFKHELLTFNNLNSLYLQDFKRWKI